MSISNWHIKRKLSKDGSTIVTNEVINTITHLAASIFSLLGMVLLIVNSSIAKKPWSIISFSIYGSSLLILFVSSTLHHGVNYTKKVEAFLRLLDYFSIFPLIAGTYTPVCLIILRNSTGWSVFGVIWGVAAIGITLKAVFPAIPKWVTSTFYMCMGWIGIVMAKALYYSIGILGMFLLLLGAFFYTIGFIVFSIEKPNPVPGKFAFHEIWHILVVLGALSHYLMMYLTVMPI